jgi:hypothetical protein
MSCWELGQCGYRSRQWQRGGDYGCDSGGCSSDYDDYGVYDNNNRNRSPDCDNFDWDNSSDYDNNNWDSSSDYDDSDWDSSSDCGNPEGSRSYNGEYRRRGPFYNDGDDTFPDY